MVDSRAGVRITARHCFLLELLSTHVRPSLSLSVRPSPSPPVSPSPSLPSSPSEPRRRRAAKAKTKAKHKDAPTRGSRPDVAEAQFEDDMWDELVDGGYICGEERWLIGQDRAKRITIVRF